MLERLGEGTTLGRLTRARESQRFRTSRDGRAARARSHRDLPFAVGETHPCYVHALRTLGELLIIAAPTPSRCCAPRNAQDRRNSLRARSSAHLLALMDLAFCANLSAIEMRCARC